MCDNAEETVGKRAYAEAVSQLRAALAQLDAARSLAKQKHVECENAKETLKIIEVEAKHLRAQRCMLVSHLQEVRLELADTKKKLDGIMDELAT